MSVLKKMGTYLAAPALAASLFFAPDYAGAMEIKQFDQLSDKDSGKYVEILFGESARYLIRNDRVDESYKLLALFKRKPSGEISDGMREFLELLKELRELERQGLTKKTPHVEHAMAITLKRHGIAIALNDMMQFAKDFQPQDKGFAEDKAPSKPSAAVQGSDEFKLAKN